MRGPDEQTQHMFSYPSPGQRVPADHPLRAVRALIDEALRLMSAQFERPYSTTGRPSIPPEQLLRAIQQCEVSKVDDIKLYKSPSKPLKWSRLFGQFEGFDKVYPGCEVTPSSSGLIIAKMTMRCGSVGVSRLQRRHGRQRAPARLPRACGRPPRRPSDSALRRPGVHRPGTSRARRTDAVTAPILQCPLLRRAGGATAFSRRATPAVSDAGRTVRMLKPHAPRRRFQPAYVRQEPSANAHGRRTSSTPQSPARPRTRRPVREDTQLRTSATATAAR